MIGKIKFLFRSVRVKRIIRHPQYNLRRWDSDVALIQLSETLIMTDTVRPICLPNTTEEFQMVSFRKNLCSFCITDFIQGLILLK